MRNRRALWGIIGLLTLLILLLAGCIDIRQEVTLKPEQQWEAVMKIVFPASTVQQLGEEMMNEQQQDFDQQKQEAEREGVKADIEMRKESNGDIVYEMKLEGEGWDKLNKFVFSDEATIADAGGGRVSFRYNAEEFTGFKELGGSYILVIKSGQINKHNATRVSGGTATWENPTSVIEAEVTPGVPAGGISVALIIVLVIVGIIVLAIVAFILLYLRGKRQSAGQAGGP